MFARTHRPLAALRCILGNVVPALAEPFGDGRERVATARANGNPPLPRCFVGDAVLGEAGGVVGGKDHWVSGSVGIDIYTLICIK